MNKKIDWRIFALGMVCITFLESIALMNGIDGILLTSVIGILAIGIGIQIPREKIIK